MKTFGTRISKEVTTLGREAETHPPVLQQYNGWGQRIDELITSEAWRRLHDVSAEEGLVAIGYERKYAQWRWVWSIMSLSCDMMIVVCTSSVSYSCSHLLLVFTPVH